MRNYCLYRISCTIQLICFFFFAIVAVNPHDFYNDKYADSMGNLNCMIDHNVAFTLPVLSLVIITILNDGTIITIAYDKVIPENLPQKWDMTEVRGCMAQRQLCCPR
jgi:H+-transporting ATPase